MKITSLYRQDAPTIDLADSLADAAIRMREEEASALVVLRDGRPVGITTERDLAMAVADGVDAKETRVASYMTPGLFAVSSEDETAVVARRMQELGVRHLLVARKGEVVGIISARDLLAQEA